MKTLLLISIIGFITCCKERQSNQKGEIVLNSQSNQPNLEGLSPQIIVQKIFGKHIRFINKTKDSINLFNTYNIMIEKNDNPIYITFEKCSPFLNKIQFDNNFKLLDTTEWNEEALVHKHFFYKKDNYIFIIDTFDDNELPDEIKCLKNNMSTIVEQIRIYDHSEYLKFAKKSLRSNFSQKVK